MCRLMLGLQKFLGWMTRNNKQNQNTHVVVTKWQDKQPFSRYPELTGYKLLAVHQDNELLPWIFIPGLCSAMKLGRGSRGTSLATAGRANARDG